MNSDQKNSSLTNVLQRTFWILIGMSTFIWFGHEDRSTCFPILLGGLISLMLALDLGKKCLQRHAHNPRNRMVIFLLTGASAGLLAMPLAAISMLVKISIHDHTPPDFSLAQLLSALGRTPIWALAGTLIGFALGLWRMDETES